MAQLRHIFTQIQAINKQSQNKPKVNLGSIDSKAGATGTYAIAVGVNAKANEQNNIAIGKDAMAKQNKVGTTDGNGGAIAIGYSATAANHNAIAIGRVETIENTEYKTEATGNGSTAIGAGSSATQTQATAYGVNAKAKGISATALGSRSEANGKVSLALGYYSQANALHAIGIGSDLEVNAEKSIAMGTGSEISTAKTIAIGNYITDTAENSVFLGNHSAYIAEGTTKGISKTYLKDTIANTEYKFAGGDKVVGVVSIGNTDQTRRLQNLAPGFILETSTDAINGSQLYALVSAINKINENVENLKGSGEFDINAEKNENKKDVTIQTKDTLNVVGDGKNITTEISADDTIKVALKDDISINSATFGDKAKISNDGTNIKIADKDGNAVKITNLAKGTADTDGVNISQLKDIIGIIGGETTIQNGDITTNNIGGTGENTINGAIEYVNNKATNGSPYLKFDETDKTPAKASGKNSSVIGVGTSSSGENSVSIGYNSNDNGRANTISVGSTGNERTISNVAPGVLGTDAVNVNQLNSVANNLNNAIADVRDDANAGVAGALVVGNLPQSTIPGKGLVSIGGAYYEGEGATAIGVSKMSDNAKWVFKGSATINTQNNAGVAASVGFHF